LRSSTVVEQVACQQQTEKGLNAQSLKAQIDATQTILWPYLFHSTLLPRALPGWNTLLAALEYFLPMSNAV
jgi:hypothetical protein